MVASNVHRCADGLQKVGTGRTLMPAHRFRRAMPNSPLCVTYHRPLRSSKSPEAIESRYSLVSSLSPCNATGEIRPHNLLAILLLHSYLINLFVISIASRN